MMALPDLVCPVEVLLDLFSTDLELEACKTNLKTQACSAKWPRLVDTVAESHQERQKKKIGVGRVACFITEKIHRIYCFIL